MNKNKKRFVIAMDSFKGCMSSDDAGLNVKRGVLEACPDAEVLAVPVGDGGEGTARALGEDRFFKICKVCGPLGDTAHAVWYLDRERGRAYIDMASACGLGLARGHSPLYTTSYGLGQLIANAVALGAEDIIVGLGGSATNDAALGALQALGAKITLSDGRCLDTLSADRFMYATGENMADVRDIAWDTDSPLAALRSGRARLTLVCDVLAPLTGPDGAAQLYAPQKFATPEHVEILEQGLYHLRDAYCRLSPGAHAEASGDGAAGGCGLGLRVMAGGQIVEGGRFVLEQLGLRQLLTPGCVVITGEGRADRQTLQGKLPLRVKDMAKEVDADIPVILLCGQWSDRRVLEAAGFAEVININMDYWDSHDNPLLYNTAAHRLREAGRKVALSYQ